MAACASIRPPSLLPRSESKPSPKPSPPSNDSIETKLLRKGVTPTPKILHALRKKETQKHIRRAKKQQFQTEPQNPVSDEESLYRQVAAEYRSVRAALAGKPWEGPPRVDLRGLGSEVEGDVGGRLKGEHLAELREVLAERNGEGFRWLLEDDVKEEGGVVERRERKAIGGGGWAGEEEKIDLLVRRLSSTNLSIQDWKFSRLMKQSGLIFTEMHLLKIIEGLGVLGNWRSALSVVEWVYNERDYRHHKSRFVYTKLLSILGMTRRPNEARQLFNLMQEDGQIYPDMAAYHSIAVTLGQAGFVKELINIIESMKQKPSKRIKNMKRNWDPCVEPDIIIFNAVLNACVPSKQWKGVFWVLEQMRVNGLKPTETTYGLAMEVMLKAGKYDLVHKYFEKMRRGGLAPKALTYKVLVRTFWEEGKIDEAVQAVRDMEKRGIIGTASVYYELACCLCNKGRWQDAMLEVEKLKRLPRTKPLAVTFTGMILSSLDGGYISDCISLFERMKNHCTPNIGTVNAMLKVFRFSDMFARAKELFESVKDTNSDSSDYLNDGTTLIPDEFTYNSMLESSASAHQWEYFEHVYKEMAFLGYQLNQNKHARLLVEASRAGKWHLLEHAFDTILEGGEIPHSSLFTEMICQAISQENLERTVPLINSMAHASIHVSEIQWINLFRRNKDRLSKDNLCKLLNHLNSHKNLVTEDPVPNLLRSLHWLCEPSQLQKTFLLAASNDTCGDKLALHESEKDFKSCMKNQGYLAGDTRTNWEKPNREDPTFSASGVNNANRNGYNGVLLQGQADDGGSSLTIGNEDSDSNSFLDDDSDASSSGSTFDQLTAHVGFLGSKLPSAAEILDAWKGDRIKDGIFL